MSRSNIRRFGVAAVLAAVLVVSVTGLFGASGTTVKITSPASGARVSGEVEVSATVKASSPVSYVILGVDEERPCVSNSSPYRFSFDTRTLPDGRHRLFVEAYDDFGLIASSKAITIYVKNEPSAPRKPAPAPVPAKSGSTPSARTATTPATAPTSTPAAASLPEQARTVREAEGQAVAASVAPTAVGRGPMPEPSSVAATASGTAARPSAPAVSSYASANAGMATDSPPTPGNSRPPRPAAHTIMVDGKVVAFDVAPAVVDGRLEAGFRALFGTSGGRVVWVQERRTARSESPTLTVEVPIGSRTASVNGRAVDMGATATVREGRTIIPVRFYAEATGAALNWDGETKIASLTARAPTKRAQAE